MEKYCESVVEKALLYVDQVILVDDGSIDGTHAILQNIQQRNRDRTHLIVFPKNQGKGAALLAGMKYALTSTPFEVLVTLDADGQHLPSEIPKLVSEIAGEVNFAIGCRQFNQMPFRSRFANTLISFFLHRLFPEAPHDNQSGFRAFSRTFTSEIVDRVTGCRYEMEFRCILLALHNGYKIASCPIHTIYLDKNRSSHFAKFGDSFRILRVFFQYWRSKSI